MTEILDCTLRDGSYVNGFQFSTTETSLITKGLSDCGIKYIEVGHGLGLGASRKGGEFLAAETDQDYLKAAVEYAGSSLVGVFCIPGIATLDDIKMAHAEGANFIRIGCNVDEVESTKKYIECARNLGMEVCANYMKSYVIPPGEFVKQAKTSYQYGAQVIYLVDSAGGMLREETKAFFTAIKNETDIPFGFHGHNNLGLAVSHSMLAMDMGAKLVDTSLQGLGRSAGNTSTEQFLLCAQRTGRLTHIPELDIIAIGDSLVSPHLKPGGIKPIDLISGQSLFHSSYYPTIKEISLKYSVDPLRLVQELCKIDKLNAPEALVEELAAKLPKIDAEIVSRYQPKDKNINEQDNI